LSAKSWLASCSGPAVGREVAIGVSDSRSDPAPSKHSERRLLARVVIADVSVPVRKTQQLFSREERREVGWLAIVGTGIPFVLGLVVGPWLIRPSLAGANGNRISLIIILCRERCRNVGSRSFQDLRGSKNTSHPVRASRARSGGSRGHRALARSCRGNRAGWQERFSTTPDVVPPVNHDCVFRVGFDDCARIVKRLNKSKFNVFAKQSPVAYAIAVLLAYCVVAGVLDVSLVFAAFLAGFAVVHKKRRLFAEALDAIGKVSFAFFIPVYFAIVGLKLDLVRGLSLWMIGTFILGSCLVKILSVSLAGRLAGFRGLDLINLAITTNRTRRTWHRAGQCGV